MSVMQTETVLLREELATANSNLLQQQHENSALRTENTALLNGHRRQMQVSLYTMFQNCFSHNFVKFLPTLVIFGTKMARTIELCKVDSFATSSNLCQCTTV